MIDIARLRELAALAAEWDQHESGEAPAPLSLFDIQAALREAAAELETLRAKVERYEGRLCLVCGAREPCSLANDEYSPCTFDPNPIEAARGFLADIQTLRAREGVMRKALEEADWLLDANRSPPPRLTAFKAEWQTRARALLTPASPGEDIDDTGEDRLAAARRFIADMQDPTKK